MSDTPSRCWVLSCRRQAKNLSAGIIGIGNTDMTNAHDEIHTGLDYIDEVARMLVGHAMHHDDPEWRLSESRPYRSWHTQSRKRRDARVRLPGSCPVALITSTISQAHPRKGQDSD